MNAWRTLAKILKKDADRNAFRERLSAEMGKD